MGQRHRIQYLYLQFRENETRVLRQIYGKQVLHLRPEEIGGKEGASMHSKQDPKEGYIRWEFQLEREKFTEIEIKVEKTHSEIVTIGDLGICK